MHTRRSARLLTLTAVAALAVPLTACSGDDGGTPTETVTVTVGPDEGGDGESAPPSDEPTTPVVETPAAEPLDDAAPDDDAPFPANTAPDTNRGSGLVSVTDMRFGRQVGYDRLVIDLGGSGEPSWRAEYVDEARGQGSGLVVDVDGEAVIELNLQGVTYPGEDGAPPYAGPDVIVAPPGGAIREVVLDSIFEGTMQVVVGVSAETPFRVFLLEDPTRVILDVQE